MKREILYSIIITVLVFWLFDFILHYTGVGETNYYYISKLANSILFAFIWFKIYNKNNNLKKLVYSFIFGTWISFYYLIFSYSGLVQLLGIGARYTPPVFIVFGLILHPFFWWLFHSLVFFIGLELSGLVKKFH